MDYSRFSAVLGIWCFIFCQTIGGSLGVPSVGKVKCYFGNPKHNCTEPNCYGECNNMDNPHCFVVFDKGPDGEDRTLYLGCFHKDWAYTKASCPTSNTHQCFGNLNKANLKTTCCCTGDFCNDPSKIIYIPVEEPIPATEPPPEADKEKIKDPVGRSILDGPLSVFQTATVVLLPLFALSLVIIFVYWVYRKCRMVSLESERDSTHANNTGYNRWDAMPLMGSGINDEMDNRRRSRTSTRSRFSSIVKVFRLGRDKDRPSVSSVNGSLPHAKQQDSTLDNHAIGDELLSAEEAHRLKRQCSAQPWARVKEVLMDGHMSRVHYGQLVCPKGRTVLRDCVVKMLHDQALWRTEVDTYQVLGIEHPNILEFLWSEQPVPNTYWVLLAHAPLGSIHDHLKGNCLTWPQALNVAHGLAQGIHHLHEENEVKDKPSIVHRDIKSKNVLLKEDLTPCIADFGLALQLPRRMIFNGVQSQVGTPRYMAPEVLQGMIGYERQAFLSVDVYSMGLVLWEVLSRCALPGQEAGPPDYCLPYDLELDGVSPSLQTMEKLVNQNKYRPKPRPEWLEHESMGKLWRTIEECWDHDCEARLSASCVAVRTSRLLSLVEHTDSQSYCQEMSVTNGNQASTSEGSQAEIEV